MKNLIYISIISVLTFNACVEVETAGCIDPDAINYNHHADYSDGSCIYNSDIVFYEDVAAAVYFNTIGVEWLDLYVNGVYIGTLDATLGLTYIADCFETDAIVFVLEWENSHSSSFNWVIRDETGFIHYSESQVVFPNECLPIGLTFKKIQDYKESK